jgi:hypothetical protein
VGGGGEGEEGAGVGGGVAPHKPFASDNSISELSTFTHTHTHTHTNTHTHTHTHTHSDIDSHSYQSYIERKLIMCVIAVTSIIEVLLIYHSQSIDCHSPAGLYMISLGKAVAHF